MPLRIVSEKTPNAELWLPKGYHTRAQADHVVQVTQKALIYMGFSIVGACGPGPNRRKILRTLIDRWMLLEVAT